MANITQKINYFPTPPNSSQSPQDFNQKANAFVAHQANDYVNEVNAWADEANLLKDDINNIVATIPSGSIDDTVTATDKVWSSSKVDELTTVDSGVGHIKFPDGTLICMGTVQGTTGGGATGVFEVPFVSAPTVSVTVIQFSV